VHPRTGILLINRAHLIAKRQPNTRTLQRDGLKAA